MRRLWARLLCRVFGHLWRVAETSLYRDVNGLMGGAIEDVCPRCHLRRRQQVTGARMCVWHE